MAYYDESGWRKRMPVDEAEEIMENEARTKEFWEVSYNYRYDNSLKLQQALDVLFNSIPGNRYAVDYQENQNGIRLIVRCEVCDKDLSSYDPFLTHEKGKAHKKVRQQSVTPRDPNIKSELKRRPLNEQKGVFAEDSLEDMIDSASENIIGVHFVYKEVIDGVDTFTCQLCKKNDFVVAIKTAKMFAHLKSRRHIMKYMDVKFRCNLQMYSEILDQAHWVEQQEGKIHAPIVDFTKQLSLSKACAATSSNNEPLGKRDKKTASSEGHSRQRSQRSKSPTPSCSRTRDRRSRSHSRSSSIICERKLQSNSPESKANSPTIIDVRSEPVIGPRTPPLPPPPPSPPIVVAVKTPVTADVGISAEITEVRPLLQVTKMLLNNSVQEVILEDSAMQELLHQTLWILNEKLDRYYRDKGIMYCDNIDKVEFKASIMTEKLVERINALVVISPRED